MMHIRANGYRPLMAIACMAFLIVLVLGACKKDKEKGLTERLMNKWNLVQISDTVYASGASPIITQYQGKTGEYLHFKKNGKLVSFIKNTLDSVNYTYSEANFKVNVD